MTADLQQLLEYCGSNARVCPQPQRWSELYQLLPNKRPEGAGFRPGAPLILAAWWEATNFQKKERLKDHIQWTNDHGALVKIENFLRGLPENEWHHER